MVKGRRNLARLAAVLVFTACGSLMLPRAQAGLVNPYHPVTKCATVALVGTGVQTVTVTVGGVTKTATVAEAANAKAVVCAKVAVSAVLAVDARVLVDAGGTPHGLDIRVHATAYAAASVYAEVDLKIYANAVVVVDTAPADLVVHLVVGDVVNVKALVPTLVGKAVIVAGVSV